MARDVTDTEEMLRDDVVDRLLIHDIHYIGGGSAWAGTPSRYHKSEDAPVGSLILDLARSRDARLRTALVGLLLRHPEYAPPAIEVARETRDVSTALAKIERGQQRDIDDVLALCRTKALSVDEIIAGFEDIAPRIEREALPRVREDDFRRKVEAFVRRAQSTLPEDVS